MLPLAINSCEMDIQSLRLVPTPWISIVKDIQNVFHWLSLTPPKIKRGSPPMGPINKDKWPLFFLKLWSGGTRQPPHAALRFWTLANALGGSICYPDIDLGNLL